MKIEKKHLFIYLTLGLILLFFILAVRKNEMIKQEGQLVLLELAPVDPRSLMQGDYMILNYHLFQEYREQKQSVNDTIEPHKRGLVRIALDANNVGQFVSLENTADILEDNQIYIKYFNYDHARFTLGAESYFFEEGKAALFEKAKYGGLRVDNQGNSILIGLYDDDLNLIQ